MPRDSEPCSPDVIHLPQLFPDLVGAPRTDRDDRALSRLQPGGDGAPSSGERCCQSERHDGYSSQGNAGPQWSGQANVPVLMSGAIGLGITVFVLGMMSLFKGSYIADLFVDRGWVPYVLTLFMGWSIGILILKAMRLSKQRKALMVDVLPTSISHDIRADHLGGFLQHLDSIPEQLRDSFMVSRVRRGLAHFRARGSTPEVANMMSSQSEIDYSAIVGSYTQQGILEEFTRVQENMAIAQQRQVELFEQTTQSIDGLLDKTQSEAVKAMQESGNAAQHQFVKMERTLTSLNEILADLGGKKIVIQQVKRGLFGGKKHIGGIDDEKES